MERTDPSSLEPEEPLLKDSDDPVKIRRDEAPSRAQGSLDYEKTTIRYDRGLRKHPWSVYTRDDGKLEQRSDWEVAPETHYPIELLESVQELNHNTQDHEYKVHRPGRSKCYGL
jgi:hypothetical protein